MYENISMMNKYSELCYAVIRCIGYKAKETVPNAATTQTDATRTITK
jgi:hypothetical protein